MSRDLDYSYEEFLLFLLLYVSHVDMDFDESEQNELKNKFSPKIFQPVYEDFLNKTDYQSLELILSYREKYFSTPEEKDKLLDMIKIQFSADGVFDTLEQEVFHFLNRLM